MTEKTERIQMAHGSGGKLSARLFQEVFFPAFANPALAEVHDGARLTVAGGRLAFATDSYVVKPRFFPGGDIGKLAVCGTVNDLAMTGAEPLYLSAGFILEEGLPIAELMEIVRSMQRMAVAAGVQIVTGDTKVVEKGAADGIYINTAGIGRLLPGVDISAGRVRPGQTVLLSGSLGDHGIAVMGERHGLTLPATVVSDCAPLNALVAELLAAVPAVSWLRDPTRGGLAAALNELAGQTGLGVMLEEADLPVKPEVAAVCDILGFDPLYLANEGKLIAIVENESAEEALAVLRRHPCGTDARAIGRMTDRPAGQVGLKTRIGGVRLLDMPLGDQLPRIC